MAATTLIPIVLAYFMSLGVYSVLFLYLKSKHQPTKYALLGNLPKVSVLLAARNEAAIISQALDALLALDYPSELLEICIGNDGSTDNTFSIISAYSQKHSNIKILNVNENLNGLVAKANVLAQLAHLATGEYYFVTDADTVVKPTWVKECLQYFAPNLGIVCGTTLVQPESIMTQFQSTEWMQAFGVISALSVHKIPITAIGNNMCVSKAAYWSVGGYENIPFSITEDYQLFHALIQKGWGFVQLFDSNTLNFTKGIVALTELWHQRKRWMTGVVKVSWVMKIFLALQMLYFPILTLGLLHAPLLTIVFANIELGVHYFFINDLNKKIKQEEFSAMDYLMFRVYSWLVGVMSFVAYISPSKTIWKSHKY